MESKDVVVARDDGVSRTVTFGHSVDGVDVESQYVEYDTTEEGMERAVTDVGDERVLHLYNMQARIEARNSTASRNRAKTDNTYAAELIWAAANQPKELANAQAGTTDQMANYLKQTRKVLRRIAKDETD